MSKTRMILQPDIPQQAALDRLPERPHDGRTHFDGCWAERGHHNCAVEHIRRLTADVRAMWQEREAEACEITIRETANGFSVEARGESFVIEVASGPVALADGSTSDHSNARWADAIHRLVWELWSDRCQWKHVPGLVMEVRGPRAG